MRAFIAAMIATAFVAHAGAEDKGIGPKHLPIAIQSRADFIQKCRPGGTQKACREGVGEPRSVQRIGGEDTWYYNVPLLDPASGKKTSRVQVLFNEDGKVRGLNFY